MNFLTGWNLNVCSAGSGLVWVMLRVQDLGVWGRQKGLCWHRCCCIRFFDHCKSGYGNIKGVTRESTNSPKGKKICSLLNWEKSAPTQETLLCFICVALSIAPPAQLFVGMQLLWSCFLHLCWLNPRAPDLRGAGTASERWYLYGQARRTRSSTELHVGGQHGSCLLWAYICGNYVSFQMHFLVASYLSTGYWTCYFLKHIVRGSWLKSCCSVSLFFHLAKILSYSFC